MTEPLEAGRELDWLIAEKVTWGDAEPLDEHRPFIPRYSTDLLAAMTVLARFKTWSLICEDTGEYTCYLDSDWTREMARDLMDYRTQASADTPALAICRAALAAVGAMA